MSLPNAARTPSVEVLPFGSIDGQPVEILVLRGAGRLVAEVTTYGATLVRLFAPDRSGRLQDVLVGPGDLAGYRKGHPYMGSTVGRFANRIRDGRFSLDGKVYALARNNVQVDPPQHLHGGNKGFDKQLWTRVPMPAAEAGTDAAVRLRLVSPDGDEGYPGNLTVEVTYRVAPDDTLAIDYTATTDQATVVNLTNHAYFNLKGDGQGDILGHAIQIRGSHVLPVGSNLIPTGERRPVAGSALDFLAPRTIGERIAASELAAARGYDHCYVIDRQGPGLVPCAVLSESASGRTMTVATTEPGVQLYVGNFLDGTVTGKNGQPIRYREGLCLETQGFPDAPNQPSFPSAVLHPGQVFRSRTEFRFTVA